MQRAFQATYGYEFQGDNLLIARLNLLMTFEEYMVDRWRRKPNSQEYKRIIDIIVWNLWQMDGLTCAVPCRRDPDYQQLEMRGWNLNADDDDAPVFCRVRNWRHLDRLEFRNCSEGEKRMKFDFVIGNARDILGLNAEIALFKQYMTFKTISGTGLSGQI